MNFSVRDFIAKLALMYGFFILLGFIIFRSFYLNLTPTLIVFSILLLLAELHNSLQFFTMLYSLWPRNYHKYGSLFKSKKAQINMFICVCGEPLEIVKSTIVAAIAARDKYMRVVKPRQAPNIVVLNDGFAANKEGWYEIENLAKTLNVAHLKRTVSTGFKAGNINNGLKYFTTQDSHNTYDIVLDADFAVIPDFLLEIIRPFKNRAIDFVQTPQRYSNETTWVAKAAAAHQIHFFNHVCPAKANDNALFLCGTNFAIRRSALDAVGGMDERFITEDYATSLNLHLAGKKGVFIKKPLAYGIAPSSLKAYFSQQQRWSKGTFDTSREYIKKILFGPLTVKQKFQYLISSIYYLSGIRNLIFMLAPLPYLFFDKPLMNVSSSEFIMLIYGPLFFFNFLTYVLFFRHPLKSWVLDTISFPIFISALISSIFKKKLGFVVTIKKYQKENIFKVYYVQMSVALLLLAGFTYAVQNHRIAYSFGQYMNYFWVVFNISILLLGFYLYLKDNYIISADGLANSTNNVKRRIVGAFEIVLIGPLFLFIISLVINQNYLARGLVYAGMKSINATHLYLPKSPHLIIPSGGLYYGYYLPELNAHPKNPTIQIGASEKPSLTMYYQDWGDKKDFDIEYMNSLASKNIVPIITWEPWSAQKAAENDLIQPEYSPKLIASGMYDEYIIKWARSAAVYGKPYFLRFAHEMNGDWYSWGAKEGNTPEDYKRMWMHVHDIFEKEGATNTIWVWSPNNEDGNGSTDSVMDYYPPDTYVDWVSYSGFNWGNSATTIDRSFEDLTIRIYTILQPLNKPIMVAETATTGTDEEKREWFNKTIEEVQYFGSIKAIVFYNEDFKGRNFKFSQMNDADEMINKNFTENSYLIKNPILEITSKVN